MGRSNGGEVECHGLVVYRSTKRQPVRVLETGRVNIDIAFKTLDI